MQDNENAAAANLRRAAWNKGSSAGNGGPNHLFGELFKAMTRVSMVHVPYRGGGPAINDLLGGQIQVFWVGMPVAIEYIRAARHARWR